MTDVPSNLIPTRITQLPTAPVADEDSLMMIVYQGNNYQIRVGDLLNVAGVPTTRQVIAGTGLQGGGQLSSNVTLSIAPGGVGSSELANSGVTPGVYGSGTQVPVFTVDATGRVMAVANQDISTAGVGTVTSVGLALPSEFSVSGSPVITTGTLTGAWANQTTNKIFAAPNGSTGTPSFRALVNDDIPSALSGKAITTSTIDSTPIGGTSPAAGTFTSVDSDYVDFAPALSPLPTDATGRLYYDNNDQFQTLVFQMNGSVVQKIGEEQYFRIKCSSAITKGQVVMFTGTLGSSGGLTGAPATGLTADQANYILGIAAESGSTNDWIFVTYFGEVKGINTTGGGEAWTQGQVLYYNPSVTGGLTDTKPNTPNAIAIVAAVIHAHASNGILFVRPTFGSVLGGTDGNVQFGSLNNGDVIVYDSVDQRWENFAQSTLAVGTATNIAGGAANQIPYNTGAGATSFIDAPTTPNTYLEWSGAAFQWSANPLGTVTSVGLALPSEFTITNSPVTSSGTLTGAWASQTANYVFAAPNGAPGTPSFRALVAADIPTLNQNTTGNAATATNIAGGIASQIPYQTGANTTSFIANGTAGQVLTSNGTSAPAWSGINGGTF